MFLVGLTALLWLATQLHQPEKLVHQTAGTQPQATVLTDVVDDTAVVLTVATAPDLQLSGSDFELYTGLKDILDSLILSANSSNKAEIMAKAENWCQTQKLHRQGCARFQLLLSRYLDYKIALSEYDTGSGSLQVSIDHLSEKLAMIQDLRYQWFTEPEINALFGEDQAIAEQALARRQIAMASDIDKDEKQRLLTEQLENLPEAQKRPLLPTLQMNSLQTIKQQYQDIHLRVAEAEAQFGPEAAQRLEKTWRARQAFKNKIAAIATQYHTLKGEPDSSVQAQQNALLNRHFEGRDIRRARALLKHYQTDQQDNTEDGAAR